VPPGVEHERRAIDHPRVPDIAQIDAIDRLTGDPAAQLALQLLLRRAAWACLGGHGRDHHGAASTEEACGSSSFFFLMHGLVEPNHSRPEPPLTKAPPRIVDLCA
jgi:hypothetical protein